MEAQSQQRYKYTVGDRWRSTITGMIVEVTANSNGNLRAKVADLSQYKGETRRQIGWESDWIIRNFEPCEYQYVPTQEGDRDDDI